MGDPARIRQILRNLVTNAVRHGGDTLRVEVGVHGPSSVYVSVRDNGQEVSQEYRDQMFQPFVRTHDDAAMVESVGLGLAVSRQLAVLMGGDLVYFYDAGESVFELSLPAAIGDNLGEQTSESRSISA